MSRVATTCTACVQGFIFPTFSRSNALAPPGRVPFLAIHTPSSKTPPAHKPCPHFPRTRDHRFVTMQTLAVVLSIKHR
jgi:hypothetical protein